MRKVASATVIGFALVAMGCQGQTALPAQTPQGGIVAPPAPPLVYGGEADIVAHHHECPCKSGFHREGGEAWERRREADDERMGHHEHAAMAGRWRRGSGPGEGNTMPSGGQDVMRELAELDLQFYPPAVLLQHAETIGLTPDQMTKIRQELLGTQARGIDLRAKIEHAKIEVTRLLAAEKIDERAVDTLIDEAARGEAELHKLHLGAMLHVHALLTPEQRQKLEESKPEHEEAK